MRAVIAGAGKIGRYLARDLHARGHEVVLIDHMDAPLAKVPDDGVTRVLGDACAPSLLERAGVRAADVLVAATGDDEDNLVISLLAKQEFAVPRVLARVNYPENEWLFDDAWGVDLAVSPPHLLTSLVEEDITEGDVVSLLKLRGGEAELVELRLDAAASAVGLRVGDLDLPPNTALLAVVRGTSVVPCRDATPLAEGDEILALVRPGHAEEVRDLLIGAR